MTDAQDDDLVAETLQYLVVEDDGAGCTAVAPPWFGDYLFGGFVIAQAIVAAWRWAPAGKRMHSLHAYFLRPVRAGLPVRYDGETIREGRSFSASRLEASQDGKTALTMLASFTTDTDGYEYDVGAGAGLPALDEAAAQPANGPWVACPWGPTEPRADGTRESTHRMWFRIPGGLPADEVVHAALMGFATDWTGTGGRPLHLEGDTQGMVSLDHSVWFHRPARADDWHFFDVQSLVNAGGRGLLRGVIRDRAGHVVLSMAQEMRLTPVP